MVGEPDLQETLGDQIVVMLMRRDRLDPGEVRHWILDTAVRLRERNPILQTTMPLPRDRGRR